MTWLHALIQGLWVILPAYIANGAAPILGGERRMDFGKTFRGNDLLGGGKTWEGFAFAIASGTSVGFLQTIFWPYANEFAAIGGYSLPRMTVIIAFLISVLAMFGDALASFFKRRLSLERGKGVPLLDQLDFLILPLPLVIILSKISYLSLILILVVTPPIHFLFNLLAYHLGLKEVPW